MVETYRTIVGYVAVPIMMLVLIVLMTQSLWHERQDMLPNEEITKSWQRGAGVESVQPIPIVEWQSFYGGGEGTDEVVALSGSSLRISTGGDGGWYGARTDIEPGTTLENKSISLAVFADDWQSLDRFMVLFGTNDSFTDYYGINLKNYFSNPASQEWIEVVLERSSFEVIEGAPSWEEVSDIAIRVVPKPAVSTRVWIDDIQMVDESSQAPVISFTFDDGFKSVTEAASILNTYGYAGTAFVIPRLLGTDGYMVQDDIDNLHALGWDISGHSNLKLTEHIASDVDTELALMFGFLNNRDYQGQEHFAYPNGAYNQSVKSQVLEYFKSARTIDGFSQPTEYAYPQNINAITISSSTPVTDIVKEIDKAQRDNAWLILVWHDFNLSPASEVEYNMEDFRWLVSHINNLEIEVQPYSVAYSRFYE